MILLSSIGIAPCTYAADLTISAASSLTDAFKALAKGYETQYPEDKIRLNFAASGSLLQQIANGAPVDIFASADQITFDFAEKKGLLQAGSRVNFAHNQLLLIAPKGSKIQIKGFQDLHNADIKRIAIGNPATVPAGRYASAFLKNVGMLDLVQSKFIHTQNTRQSLIYVMREEVDAGFVYASDIVHLQDRVTVIEEIPLDMPILYPIGIISSSSHAIRAHYFIDYLRSLEGKKILQQHGFITDLQR